MLLTLKEYFTTGYKDENYRNTFYNIKMCIGEGNIKETFTQFAIRFKNLAILGNILKDD